MYTLVISLLVLGVLVFIHELGHFLVAKLSGIKVEVFSLGFGKPLIHKQVGETDYRIAMIPLGGYVKMSGETDFDKPLEEMDERSFLKKNPWIRVAVVFAGPFMNFILALGLFVFIFAAFGITHYGTKKIGRVEGSAVKMGLQVGDELVAVNGNSIKYFDDFYNYLQDKGEKLEIKIRRSGKEIVVSGNIDSTFVVYPDIPAVIGGIRPGNPADKFGLKIGDEILAINDTMINNWYDMSDFIHKHPNDEIVLKIKRDDKIIVKNVKTSSYVTYDAKGNKNIVGIIGINFKMDREKLPFSEAVAMGIEKTVSSTTVIFTFFEKLITGKMSAKLLGGPIMIYQVTGETAKMGLSSLLNLMALLSVNLGFINLLPFPVLDGGYIVLYFVEGITKKRLPIKILSFIQYIGIILLLLLTIYVTFNDIMRLAR